MKRLFFGLGVLFAGGVLHAQAPADIYNTGVKALGKGDYATATQSFDNLITNFPNTPNMDQIYLDDGLAYLRLGNFTNAIARLSRETAPPANADYRAPAFYYTGLAQLLQAPKLKDSAAQKAMFSSAAATMTQLITYVTATPSPTNNDYLEDAYYNRATAYFYAEDYPSAEKDLLQVLKSFPTSLRKPDYLLLLGNLYAREADLALVAAKKPTPDVQHLADQAIERFDQVSRDPNALVQANGANLSEAEVYFFMASADPANMAGFEKALQAFRTVKRKADMIPLQQANLDAQKARAAETLSSGAGAAANASSRLIDRETDRLEELQNGPDPIIEALIRIAQCYNAMSQGDNARTVFHRLVAHPGLTKQQQQDVDFGLIYSYVLGGQTDKADKALTDYLAKHPGDPQAQGIRVQMAEKLLQRGDNKGALVQADKSLAEFPTGENASDAVELKVAALTGLDRFAEAAAAGNEFLAKNPNSPAAAGIVLSLAQAELTQGKLTQALADFGKIMNNAAIPAVSQAGGAAGYIQTLQALGRYDDVIAASKNFATKYPTNPALGSVLVLGAVAMDQKHDPGAIPALQDVARRFPSDDANSPAPFALFYVVNIYQRAEKIPEMIQAAEALKKAFPKSYSFLMQAADAVSAVYVKQKKFDLAIAQYQPLMDVPKVDVAASASEKAGDIWIGAAKALSRSSDPAKIAEEEKRLGAAEDAYMGVLKKYPDQRAAVNDSLLGLDDDLVQRRAWGLLKEADFESYLTKLTADVTSPEIQAHIELSKAGLPFIYKDGSKEYPAALARFKAAISAHPQLQLTREETNRFGELLLAAKDYDQAMQVYTDMLTHFPPSDLYAQAEANYGVGATYLAKNDAANAAKYFRAMKALPGGALWNPHIIEANFGLALADEQAGKTDEAKQSYGAIMQSPQADFNLQARSMLGYGRILAKEGFVTTPKIPGTIEYAVHYYLQVNLFYGTATPEWSAEGLYNAGQAYAAANDKTNAQKQYQIIESTYKTTAPDWAAKAEAAMQ